MGADVRVRLDSTRDYRRDEGQTYLTHPEWYIVYSSDEYSDWLHKKQPTDFPYVKAIGQYWALYDEARRLTAGYPLNLGYHISLSVIGVSYSAELALKGIYENTIGRFSGWTNGHRLTPEDTLAANIASDYGRFIHVRPFYEYKFARHLRTLWFDMPDLRRDFIRRLERRLFLTTELGIKAAYSAFIEKGTRASYEPQADVMQMVVTGWSESNAARDPRITFIGQLDSVHTLVSTPRYDVFRDIMLDLSRQNSGLRIIEIAGNDEILVTGVAPPGWSYVEADAQTVHSLPLPSDSKRERFGERVRVKELLSVLRKLEANPQVVVDHIYDY